jgi:hypothetical protein
LHPWTTLGTLDALRTARTDDGRDVSRVDDRFLTERPDLADQGFGLTSRAVEPLLELDILRLSLRETHL